MLIIFSSGEALVDRLALPMMILQILAESKKNKCRFRAEVQTEEKLI